MERAPEFLEDGGSLQMVAYHNKGGKRIREFMRKVFGNVEELCKTGGIRVYRSIKGLKEDEDNTE